MFTSVLEQKKLSMTCIYIPPNATTIATFDVLSTYLEQHISDPQSLHVLCGDFNVNFLSKRNKQSYLRELTQTFDMKLISEILITRETKNSSFYIDKFVFFTNFESEVTRQGTKIADHYSLFLILKNKTNLETEFNLFSIKNLGKTRKFFLQEKISFVLWQRLKQIDLTERKIIDKFKCSQRIVQEALDHYLPKKTRKHAQKIWIDNEVKNAAARKKKLWKKALKGQSITANNEYKQQCKKVKTLIKNKMKTFYQNQIEKGAANKNRNFSKVYGDITGKKIENHGKIPYQEEVNHLYDFLNQLEGK